MIQRIVLAICSILLIVHAGFASIVFDVSSTTDFCTFSETALTFSHTTADQAERLMLISCAIMGATTTFTVTGVTYNGDAATNITSVGTSTNSYVSVYKLVAPDTGTHDVVASFSGTVDGYMGCVAETVYGVDQSTMHRTAATRTSGASSETSSTLTPDSSVGDLVMDFIAWRYSFSSPTIGGSQTEHVNLDCTGGTTMKGSSAAGTTTTTTMTWSWTADTGDSHIAVAIIPSSPPTNAGFPLKDIFSPIVVQ